jgi:transcriptional antiterminator NusG
MAEDITPEKKTEEVPQAVQAPAAEDKEKTEEVPQEVVQAPAAEDRKWYVIQTLTGNEELVKASIERTIKQFSLENKVFSVLVPEEDIVEIKEGKRVEKKKKMFPGYVFVEMILDESSWHAIKQTPGVAKFIGNKTRPIPVTDREMQRVLKQLGVREERIDVFFEKGEAIRIISGPFRGYTGSVEEINTQRSKIKALVNIFGRDTPMEIDFEQAEKIT